MRASAPAWRRRSAGPWRLPSTRRWRPGLFQGATGMRSEFAQLRSSRDDRSACKPTTAPRVVSMPSRRALQWNEEVPARRHAGCFRFHALASGFSVEPAGFTLSTLELRFPCPLFGPSVGTAPIKVFVIAITGFPCPHVGLSDGTSNTEIYPKGSFHALASGFSAEHHLGPLEPDRVRFHALMSGFPSERRYWTSGNRNTNN